MGNKIINAIWAVAIMFFVASLGTFFWFVQYRPPAPEPQFGFTEPINNHGSIHYVTKGEDILIDALDSSAAAMILVAIFLSWKYKKQK